MKLLADENIHVAIVKGLRAEGYDVIWIVEGPLVGGEDEIILEKARAESRVIVTCDKDFGRLVEFDRGTPPVGVILLRYMVIDPNQMLIDLRRVLKYIETAGLADRKFIVVLEEGRFRLREEISES